LNGLGRIGAEDGGVDGELGSLVDETFLPIESGITDDLEGRAVVPACGDDERADHYDDSGGCGGEEGRSAAKPTGDVDNVVRRGLTRLLSHGVGRGIGEHGSFDVVPEVGRRGGELEIVVGHRAQERIDAGFVFVKLEIAVSHAGSPGGVGSGQGHDGCRS